MATNRLRELREETAGLSQEALGSQLDPPVNHSTISRWEAGRTGIPDWRKAQLAEHLGVSVPHLMGWNDDEDDNGEEAAA